MAKCKLCKKIITDGTEYCNDCVEKKDLMANESYLDSLLNSVQNQATTASDIYKKKKEEKSNTSPNIVEHEDKDEDEASFIDPDDLKDYDQFDIYNEFEDPIIISDEELYDSTDVIDDEKLYDATYAIDDEEYIDKEEEDNFQDQAEEEEQWNPLDMIDDIDESYLGITKEEEQELPSEQIENIEQEEAEHNIDNEFLEINEPNQQSSIQDEYTEPILDDLLQHLDMFDNDQEEVVSSTETDSDSESIIEVENLAENELLDLLNQFNPDNPIEDDIQAISDLLVGISTNQQPISESPQDVGEVFSEALGVVSDLEDSDQGINYVRKESDESDSSVRNKGSKKSRGKSKEKKKGFLTKLFEEFDDEDLSSSELKSREEEAAAKKQKKKKAKIKKSKISDIVEDEELSGRQNKEDLPPGIKKAKKPKREKKRIEILDDDIDIGHINKTGASIVFLFFGILVILLIISTNIFSYSLSIRNASDYFGRQRYTQAYNEVYGIDLKDEDIELYDKIMTVMFVNKQLNSYNSYYHMRKFPEALDSLLKGLQRYDKYIELATMLGIDTDLDYVRNQLLAELYNVFSLTEEEAMSIINSESQAKYSMAVYDVILDNISFYN